MAMPTLKSESKSEVKSESARRPGSRKASQISGNADLRAVIDQRDRLYNEARQNPDSEAGEMVQTYLLSGMLAGKTGASRAPSANERRTEELEHRVREQGRRLDEIAQAAQKAMAERWDRRTLCNRIAEMVGLAPPSGIPVGSEEYNEVLQHPQRAEEICQRLRSETSKS